LTAFTVTVPPRLPPPGFAPSATVTEPINAGTTRPWALRAWTTGWVASGAPAWPPTGWVENASRSATSTVKVAVAWLLPVAGSGSWLVTCTLAIWLPPAAAVARTVTVAEAPAGSVPSWQMTGALPWQLPWLVLAETNVKPAGRISVSAVPGASDEPGLLAVAV
jgi:hypothetical protein